MGNGHQGVNALPKYGVIQKVKSESWSSGFSSLNHWNLPASH